MKNFSPMEQEVILSLARLALSDAEIFDQYVASMEHSVVNSDSFLKSLQEKLEKEIGS